MALLAFARPSPRSRISSVLAIVSEEEGLDGAWKIVVDIGTPPALRQKP